MINFAYEYQIGKKDFGLTCAWILSVSMKNYFTF